MANNSIKVKHGAGVPSVENLEEYELGFDHTNNLLYIKGLDDEVIPLNSMADYYTKTESDGKFVKKTDVIDVAHGGTGQTTIPATLKQMFPTRKTATDVFNVAVLGDNWDNDGYISSTDLRTKMGIGAVASYGVPLPVAQGGTGTTALSGSYTSLMGKLFPTSVTSNCLACMISGTNWNIAGYMTASNMLNWLNALSRAGGAMTGNITWAANAKGRIQIGGKYALGAAATTAGTYIIVGDSTGTYAPYNVELQSTDRIYLNIGSEATSQLQFLKVTGDSANTAYFRPMNNGKVTSGTSNYRWYRSYVANAESVSSDIRLKENIKPLSDTSIDLFNLLKPVTFKKKDTNGTHFGFIAQDVIKAFETIGLNAKDYHIVDGFSEEEAEKSEYYGLSYTELIPINTFMIKSLQKRIEVLEDTINQLKEVKNE